MVEDPAAGQGHVIEEPPTLALSEPSRHLPADGVALVVTVTTRAGWTTERRVEGLAAQPDRRRRVGGPSSGRR